MNTVQHTERTIILVLVVLVLFLSPLTDFWASLDAPWFSPYLTWAFAIFLSWTLQKSIKKDGL